MLKYKLLPKPVVPLAPEKKEEDTELPDNEDVDENHDSALTRKILKFLAPPEPGSKPARDTLPGY